MYMAFYNSISFSVGRVAHSV